MTKIPGDQVLTYAADMAEQLSTLCSGKDRVVAAALAFAAAIARDNVEKRPTRMKRAA